MLTRFLYRALLRLQPRRTRDEFGAEMMTVFDDAAADARSRGRFAYWRFALREVGGLLSPGVGATAARRGWRWPVAGAVVGLAAGLLVTQAVPEQYRSAAVIRSIPSAIPERFVAAGPPMSGENFHWAWNSVLSRHTLISIIQSHDLYRWERRRLPMEDVIERMQRAFEFNLRNEGRTLRMAFTYAEPAKAQRVMRDVLTRMVDETLRGQEAEASMTVEFLRRQSERAAEAWQAQTAESAKAGQAPRAVLDSDLARRHYEDLRTKLIEAQMLAELHQRRQGPTIEVLDLPSLPERAEWPHWMTIASAGAAGLFLGTLIGWLRTIGRDSRPRKADLRLGVG